MDCDVADALHHNGFCIDSLCDAEVVRNVLKILPSCWSVGHLCCSVRPHMRSLALTPPRTALTGLGSNAWEEFWLRKYRLGGKPRYKVRSTRTQYIPTLSGVTLTVEIASKPATNDLCLICSIDSPLPSLISYLSFIYLIYSLLSHATPTAIPATSSTSTHLQLPLLLLSPLHVHSTCTF